MYNSVMAKTTAKEQALSILNKLPGHASWEEVLNQLQFYKDFENGIQQVKEGKVHATEEARRMINRKAG